MQRDRQFRLPSPEAVKELFAELDRLGEAEVRYLLDTGSLAAEQVPFAREWLMRTVEERERNRVDLDRSG